RLRRAVRDRGQHPVRGDDDSHRRRVGRGRRGRRRRSDRAVVVARPRGRPRWQPHRRRRQRQRRHAGHRRAERPPHLLLAVHPIRRDHHGGHHRVGRSVRVAALLRPGGGRAMTGSGDRRPTVEEVVAIALGLAFVAAVLNYFHWHLALTVAVVAIVGLAGGLWLALRR